MFAVSAQCWKRSCPDEICAEAATDLAACLRWCRSQPYQGVWPEAVGEHHPLAERLVLVILLGELGGTVDAESGSVHRGRAPVWTEGTKSPKSADVTSRSPSVIIDKA